MRVLALVTDAFGGWGGIAQYNRDFLRAVCASDRVDRVACLPRLVMGPLQALPGKLDFVVASARGSGHYFSAVLRHACANGAWDLVYCGHVNLVPIAVPLGWILRIPVVLQLHGIDAWTPPRQRLIARLAREVDAVTSVSRLTLERFLSWSSIQRDCCCVIPCTYDSAAFHPGPKPSYLVARYGVDGKKVLLTLGRLVSQERAKGFDSVLEALPGLAQKISALTYIIAGAGPDLSRLKAKVKALGIEGTVVFTGKVPECEKADLYRLADAYVMPSRGEGFGITLLEAMACGTPVVGSTRDGTREAIRGGELGVLVDPFSLADVERGILEALDLPRGVPSGLACFAQGAFSQRIAALLDRIEQL